MSGQGWRGRFIRCTLAIQAVVALAALLTAAPAAGGPLDAGGQAAPGPLDKVEREVLDQLAARGAATFFVVLRDRADLRPAAKLGTHPERTAFVYQQLRDLASRSQARLRGLLQAGKVDYRPFWIANTVRVTGGKQLLEQITALPEVERVVAEQRAEIPEPSPGQEQARIQAVEWNIDRIRAPEVWSSFGDRGDGIVVANVDTGAQFDHPALVRQYRGNLGGGSFDHNYNWFDPAQVCASPSLLPCDNTGHGTHTMGTMVGDDGDPGGNQIGVAPHARWIAAKGCETNFCSFAALLASGEWIIAPTDLAGHNPRPELAPNIVNNSWSGPPDPFYLDIVNAWNAAGIYPVFAIGNGGAGCGSSGSPGDYPNSYSAGATDINNTIASFSSRGPSAFGSELKPNIAAPGDDVRSSQPGGGYASLSGTSMAAPHIAGTVALIWAAAPGLVGRIDETRQLLDDTAIDVEDLQCDGSADDNNVYGEGLLDAFAAVDAAPRGPTGTLTGTVTDQSTGNPVQGAAVRAVGPDDRTAFTGADGSYTIRLTVGSYDVTASHYRFLSQSATGVVVSEGQATVRSFALTPLPSHSVSGHVRDDGGSPVAGVTVTIEGTPIPPATTAADGSYSFTGVLEGEYDVSTAPGCYHPQSRHLVVDGDEILDFTVLQRRDTFGYACQPTTFDFVDASTVLPLTGDLVSTEVELPFPFTFYSATYTTAHVTTKGFLNLLAPDWTYANGQIPSTSPPNAAVYPFWDDLIVDELASVRTELLGSAPSRRFVIEWDNVRFFDEPDKRVTFEAILAETGQLTFQYQGIDDNGREKGDSATIGIENAAGDDALQFSFNAPLVSNGTAILVTSPPAGFVEGTVTDANDGAAIAGAEVRATRDGAVIRQTATDPGGHYRIRLPLGSYTVEASATDYSTETTEVVLDQQNEVIVHDYALRAARAQVSPTAVEFTVPPGQTRTKTLTLTNTGTLDLHWTASEVPVATGTSAGSVLAVGPGADPRTPQPGYVPKTTSTALNGAPTLVFMDVLPWGSEALTRVLTANGIQYDLAGSAQMGTIDLAQYEIIFFSNDQPTSFYANYAANRTLFEGYVQAGGFLWVGAAAWGWNGGDFDGGVLPGGATVHGVVFEDGNDVVDNDHPTMQGVPDPFFGFASLAVFENLPAGANVITRGQGSGLPTLIEYDLGFGHVLGFGQPLEYGWQFGLDTGRILENGVPYAFTFPLIRDVPWLAENPADGTLPPGGTQKIAVTVDTTGLAPGSYGARVVILSNDPRNPRLQVPLTLYVPAYYQAVNAGDGVYTDLGGDPWAADRRYLTGGFGYTNPTSGTAKTSKPISGTDDDPLYRTQRVNPTEYRFDGLPAGSYEVDLRFAEVIMRAPGTRLFDVIVENVMLLPALDVAAEVGSFAADQHTFLVQVTDGQLNIRFVERRGYGSPIVNGIRVIRRPVG
jgi:subtilisin family serine protease